MATLNDEAMSRFLDYNRAYTNNPVRPDFFQAYKRLERLPHRVYYADGKYVYVPPTHFFFAPYDQVWIVPGSEGLK